MGSGSMGNWDNLWMTGIVPPHGAGALSRAGVDISEKNVTAAIPVDAAIRQIGASMLYMGPPLPFQWAYADTGPYHEPVRPFPPLLLNPWGDAYRPAEGMMALVYSLALFGECFLWTVLRDDFGNPLCLDILPSPMVDVSSDKAGKHYKLYLPGGMTQVLDPASVTHIRLRPRPGMLHGASSFQEGALAYALYLASLQFSLNFFGQGIHANWVLSTDNKLDQTVVDRTLAALMINHSGLSQSHLPLFFGDGIKPAKMGTLPNEAMNLETLQEGSSMVAAYFGLPAAWLGSASTGTPAASLGRTMQEESLWFTTKTLVVYSSVIQEALSAMLPMGTACEYPLYKLVQADSGNLAKELLALRTGAILDADTIRSRWYGLGPLPNGEGASAQTPLSSNQSPNDPTSGPSLGAIMGGDNGGGR
jgi:hypothetical protein